MKGIFITGTDTDVGKTVITVGLGCALEMLNMRVCIVKPISTGGPTDIVHYKNIGFSKESLNIINPISLKKPLAPYSAGRVKKTELKKAINICNHLSKKYEFLLVEGIGGVFVPVRKYYFVSDLIKDIGLPVLVVARAGIGTINHTLLTLEHLYRKGIKIIGVVLNGFKGKDISEKTNASVLKEISGYPVFAIPYDKKLIKNKRYIRKKFSNLARFIIKNNEW